MGSRQLNTCRVAVILRPGTRFVSATLIGKNEVKHTARARTTTGILVNSRGRSLRFSPGRYEMRVRTARVGGRAVTRLYTLYVAVV